MNVKKLNEKFNDLLEYEGSWNKHLDKLSTYGYQPEKDYGGTLELRRRGGHALLLDHGLKWEHISNTDKRTAGKGIKYLIAHLSSFHKDSN